VPVKANKATAIVDAGFFISYTVETIIGRAADEMKGDE